MNEFDFLFTFYGLLLGLALANSATGLADVWRGRDEIAIGICVPLLALVLLSFAMSQWYLAWNNRDALTIGQWPLIFAVGITLPFVFVSQAMTPRNPDRWESLDAYYLANRRVILGALTVSPVVSVLANVFYYQSGLKPLDMLRLVLVVAVPLAMMATTRRRNHILGLLAISGYYLFFRLFDGLEWIEWGIFRPLTAD